MNRQQYIEKIIKGINSLNSEKNLKQIEKNIYFWVRIETDSLNRNKNWYNKRIDEFTNLDSNKWEYQTKKYLETSIKSKMSNPIFDKLWRSRFGNVDLVKSGFPTNMYSVYVSDYIMFNPNCDITLDMVDRYLPYIKFKQINDNTCQIDRWIYTKKGFYIEGSDKPNYEIIWDTDDSTENMEGIKTEKDKWEVVRVLLQIMNDTPDNFVNFNSYQVIGNWYNKYDSWLVSWESNNYKPISKNNDQDQNKLRLSELKINLDKRLEYDELVNLLYSNALYGQKDIDKTGIKSNNNFTNGFTNSIKSVYNQVTQLPWVKSSLKTQSISPYRIDKIADAHINVQFNDLDSINLEEYCIANGQERTKNLIEDINRIIQYRFNCNGIFTPNGNQITREDLLAQMYNLSLPFGMGLTNAFDKAKPDGKMNPMDVEEAKKILSESQYIDYLYGIPIKTDFSQFPIINWKKFNEYNGSEAFQKCIDSLKTNNIVEKSFPSEKYIKKEFIRMGDGV